jgi:serine protease AprX
MVMNKHLLRLWILAILSPVLADAQGFQKYWVQLKNKNGTPYSVSTPTAFLTQKSVQRRVNQGIAIHESDLPVTPSYINQIEALPDVKVLYASKWLNAVAVEITSSVTAAITTATNAINSFTFVQSTGKTNRLKVVLEEPMDDVTPVEMNKSTASVSQNYYGGAYWQNKQIRVDCIHYHGYRGQGMTIAVMDAGFSNVNTMAAFDSLRLRNGILGTRDFVTGDNNVYEDHPHGTWVLSCMAALVPSVTVGSAPRADYWLLRTEDAATETPSEEYNWIRAAEFADSVGADILTTSLGYTTFDNPSYNHNYAGLNGKTYPMSIAATMAARKGMFVLNSAGNDGNSSWQYIGVPADADSICTVGAIDSLANVTSFSSKGPTPDGRIKPDLVARGGNAFVATQSGSYIYGNGTSFSCPVLAGAVACFWQKFNNFSNMKVLDTLRKTASHGNSPNNSRGWGVPDVCALPVGLVKHNKQVEFFSVYPNPAKNNITVTIQNYHAPSTWLSLTDAAGKLIWTRKADNNIVSVDLLELPSGVYFIKLTNAYGSATEKIIKD